MDFFMDNWLTILVIIVGGILYVRQFFMQPTNRQMEQISQWLLWAVTEAEKEFGSKTGKLKLSFVYQGFVTTFPWLAKIVPVELFCLLVDKALDVMQGLIKSNPEAAAIVKGETNIKTEN